MGHIKTITNTPQCTLSLVLTASILSLSTALIAQYVFDLHPCILCLYQRVPFALAALIAAFALIIKKPDAKPLALLASTLLFLINTIIAAYHTGVERHWWRSFLEGCAVPDLGDDPAKILETIMNAPAARCDEIPWADPLLGLSMANYNVLWCAILFSICLIGFLQTKK